MILPHRAFSLLELTIALAILAVASAIAVPRYLSSLDRYRADVAARRVADDLAFARSRARSSSQARTVLFDLPLDRYAIVEEPDPDHGSGPYTIDLRREPYGAVIEAADFDDPLDPADDVRAVVFDVYGRPDSGGTVVLHAGAATRTVVLDAGTGRAAVQ